MLFDLTLTISPKVLTRRFLGWGARYGEARAGAIRSRSVSGLKRDGPGLAIALKVLTRRFLGWGARYGERVIERNVSSLNCPNQKTFPSSRLFS